MVLELVIGIIRKGIQSTIYVNAYIDLRYRLSGKSQKLFPIFSDFCIISHVLPQKTIMGQELSLGTICTTF